VTVLCVRAYDAFRAPPLRLWHTVVPRELAAEAIDAADWQAWLGAEDAVFAQVRAEVSDKLLADDRVESNRFFTGSPMYTPRFETDWNRSYVLLPNGPPRGAVVLLHGLTDSPYSLRHIARRYRELGFVAVGIRMPGHGTVPGALTAVRWEDWLAATRLAVRHARELAGANKPLHVVGYSNGGALALKYALDSLNDATLARPDQLVLISPMIGITSMARFAGVLGWPAVFPPFAKAAWLDTIPEYNPFKYNSFPVNGARQSSQLVRVVERQIAAGHSAGNLANLPPVLTFQSALDATVSTRAIFDRLYRYLPGHRHEIVVFDRNRHAAAGALVRPELREPLAGVLPAAPRDYAVTVVASEAGVMEARTVPARSQTSTAVPMADDYPPGMYSLSHVALPFPPEDGLYGYAAKDGHFGVILGTVAERGERGTLIVNAETLMRASCNPFFGYLMSRIEARIPPATSASAP
jgi:alpha-beta hydrolase superfamily lysophospholipase